MLQIFMYDIREVIIVVMLLGYFLQGLSEIFLLEHLLYSFLSPKKVSAYQKAGLRITYLFITILQVYFVYSRPLNIIVSIGMKLAISLLYYGLLYQKVLLCFLAWLSGSVSEGVVVLIIQMIMGKSIASNTELILKLMPLITVSASFVKVLFAYAVVAISHLYQMYKAKIAPLNLFLIGTFLAMAFGMLINFGQTQYMVFTLIIIGLLIVAIAICLDVFQDQLKAQRDSLKAAFLEEQLSAQLNHYELLHQQMQKVHEIRHDMKNILINIDSYLTLGEIENAREYIRRFQSEIASEGVVDTGIPLVDAVLTAKKAALINGDFRLHIAPLHCQHLDYADLCMMLAIILDNAIEGCANVAEPYVSVSIVQQGQMVSMQVSNPTNNVPTQINGLPKSSKQDEQNHGYGLRSCRRLTEKWNGNLSWSCEQGIFIIDVLLQDLPPNT